jgi:hypothetical protein
MRSSKVRSSKTSPLAATALAVISLMSLSDARAERIDPPPVPANIRIDAKNKAFLVGHALGTQNYSCLPAGVDAAGNPRFAWTLFTPQATLYAHNSKEITTHYFSPNPYEPSSNPFTEGPIRATWQHSKDTSTVWGKVVPGDSSSDAAYVAPGAIPVASRHRRRSGGRPDGRRHALVHDLHPSREHVGGIAPSTGCASHPMSAGRRSCRTPPITTSTRRRRTGRTTSSARESGHRNVIKRPV